MVKALLRPYLQTDSTIVIVTECSAEPGFSATQEYTPVSSTSETLQTLSSLKLPDLITAVLLSSMTYRT